MAVDFELAARSLRSNRPDLYEFFTKLGSGVFSGIDVVEHFEEPLNDLIAYLDFLFVLDNLESRGLVEISDDSENQDIEISLVA